MNPPEQTSADEPGPSDRAEQQAPGPNHILREFAVDHRATLLKGLTHRLREDFRLAMVSLFGLIAVAAIAPFAVFRYANGDWGIALLDLAIVAAIIIGLVIAWRFDKSESAGKMMAAIVTVSALAAILGFGLSAMWTLSVLVASFLLAASWFATILSVALISLVVGHDQAFSDSVERWTFMAVSGQVALFSLIFSWRSNQRTESLAFLAETDPLTGLGNRRALRHDLTNLVTLNHRQSLNLALVMLDLDRFKKVNDDHGHEVGDKILEDLARIIGQSTRESDRGYRFGGEEFVLILQGIDALGLEAALDHLQSRIRDDLTSPGGPVTVSIGATRVHPDDTVYACLKRADQAMYKAKKNGRARNEIL